MTTIGANQLPAKYSAVSLRTVAVVLLALAGVVSLALNWPGQLSYDSVVQLHDGRTGHYNPWHPPIMAWLLGIEDALLPGTGLFILLDTFLIYGSIASLLLLSRRVHWPTMLVAALCAVLPQFVLYQGIVWKDVLFADVAVAGFVFLVQAASNWQNRNLRWGLIVVSFLFFVLSALVRQNGAIALAFGGASLVFIARVKNSSWSKAIACGTGATLLAACTVVAISFGLLTRTGGVSGTPGQIKLLQFYDLIGIAKIDPAIQLNQIGSANAGLERLIRTDGVRRWTPIRNNTLAGSMQLQKAFNATSAAVIADQWTDVVRRRLAEYLRVRAEVFMWTFSAPDPVQCDTWYTGVTGPPDYLRSLGVARSFGPRERALGRYAATLARTPALAHITFAILAVALLPFLIWRRRPADIAIAGLLVSALVFVASFFVISIACDYRYQLFLDLAALASLFYWTVTNRSGLAATRFGSAPPTAP